MAGLIACDGCGVLVRADEESCPFCERPGVGVARVLGTLAVGFALAGCPAEGEGDSAEPSDTTTVGDVSESAYGCPPSECDEPTLTEDTPDPTFPDPETDTGTTGTGTTGTGTTGLGTSGTGTDGATDTDTDTDTDAETGTEGSTGAG